MEEDVWIQDDQGLSTLLWRLVEQTALSARQEEDGSSCGVGG